MCEDACGICGLYIRNRHGTLYGIHPTSRLRASAIIENSMTEGGSGSLHHRAVASPSKACTYSTLFERCKAHAQDEARGTGASGTCSSTRYIKCQPVGFSLCRPARQHVERSSHSAHAIGTCVIDGVRAPTAVHAGVQVVLHIARRVHTVH